MSVLFEPRSRLVSIGPRAFRKSWVTTVIIPGAVEVLGSGCFASCEALESVVFEPGSRLSMIESKAFKKTAITKIVIPKCVALIGAMCFAACQLLAAVAFEGKCQLRRIESQAFAGTAITLEMLPETIQSLATEAFDSTCQIVTQNRDGVDTFADSDSAGAPGPLQSSTRTSNDLIAVFERCCPLWPTFIKCYRLLPAFEKFSVKKRIAVMKRKALHTIADV
jgi:hypothetical protein